MHEFRVRINYYYGTWNSSQSLTKLGFGKQGLKRFGFRVLRLCWMNDADAARDATRALTYYLQLR